MVVGYRKDGSFLMVVLVVLCGMGALSWLPRAVRAAGVDLDSLPDIDDDQFWSTYKASIPYQDYVRLGQDAADYVDRYGPRQMAGENDTLFRFRRFLRIQKELDKRLLLYYEMNARQQEREREYEENRELQKLSHELHANPPHPPSSTLQQQKQHRQHRFGQYQLPYPNQQMLDDVRPYPHEDTLHNVNNDFPYDHADIFDRNEDNTESTGMQHRKHHDLTNVANANVEALDEDGQRWRSNGATVGVEASGSGAKSSGDVWEEKKGQEEFAYAPPDPRFYDAHAVTLQEQMDSQQQQHHEHQQQHEHQQHAPNHLKSLLNTPTPPQRVLPSRPRPNTFPLVPPRHIDVSQPYPFADTMKLGIGKLTMGGDRGHITSGDETAGKDSNVVVTTLPLMVHQRNSNDQQIMKSEPRESGDNGGGGGFRFNMVGKWPAFGTGIGEKHLVIGNPAAEYTDGDALQVQPVQHSHRFGAGDSAGVYIIAIVAGISAAATVGLIAFGIGWYNLQKHVKSTSDVEYPAYGVTGPNKELSPSGGDRRLAQSAQMYHYQHQKQQIIAMESRAAAGERHGSISQADSDEENEEGDYTVYECPGLAPTGEMEVKNPMFNDEPTPAQTPQIKTEQPQN